MRDLERETEVFVIINTIRLAERVTDEYEISRVRANHPYLKSSSAWIVFHTLYPRFHVPICQPRCPISSTRPVHSSVTTILPSVFMSGDPAFSHIEPPRDTRLASPAPVHSGMPNLSRGDVTGTSSGAPCQVPVP